MPLRHSEEMPVHEYIYSHENRKGADNLKIHTKRKDYRNSHTPILKTAMQLQGRLMIQAKSPRLTVKRTSQAI